MGIFHLERSQMYYQMFHDRYIYELYYIMMDRGLSIVKIKPRWWTVKERAKTRAKEKARLTTCKGKKAIKGKKVLKGKDWWTPIRIQKLPESYREYLILEKEILKTRNRLSRYTFQYKLFRSVVLERDKLKCVECGSTDTLQVHHIKPYKDYPLLRLCIENAVTLCLDCHIRKHPRLAKFMKSNKGFGVH